MLIITSHNFGVVCYTAMNKYYSDQNLSDPLQESSVCLDLALEPPDARAPVWWVPRLPHSNLVLLALNPILMSTLLLTWYWILWMPGAGQLFLGRAALLVSAGSQAFLLTRRQPSKEAAIHL